jgi:predicted dehydrogenase
MGLTYVRTFAEAILNDGEPTPTGEDGVAALRVVQGIYRSASEKRWMEIAS